MKPPHFCRMAAGFPAGHERLRKLNSPSGWENLFYINLHPLASEFLLSLSLFAIVSVIHYVKDKEEKQRIVGGKSGQK
jgi:hypothetical protein